MWTDEELDHAPQELSSTETTSNHALCDGLWDWVDTERLGVQEDDDLQGTHTLHAPDIDSPHKPNLWDEIDLIDGLSANEIILEFEKAHADSQE
jgi:hypothetical protein